MPRAKPVTAAGWPAYVASLPEYAPTMFAPGHKQTIAAIALGAGLAPDAVVWLTQRLQEVVGVVRVGAAGQPQQPTLQAELERVRRLREAAEAVEAGLRDLWPAGPARELATVEARRLFHGRDAPSPPNVHTELGVAAYITAEALRVTESRLASAARRGRPSLSVAREAVNLAGVYVARVCRDPAVLAALAGVVLDAVGAPKAGRSTAVLTRYAAACMAALPDKT
jgi:hypothetical protein